MTCTDRTRSSPKADMHKLRKHALFTGAKEDKSSVTLSPQSSKQYGAGLRAAPLRSRTDA